MVVGVGRIRLFFPQSGSLKAKRKDLRKIIERTRARFNVAVAEVGDMDTWQRATIGIAAVGNDGHHVQSMLNHVIDFVENMYVAPVTERNIELSSYGEEAFEGDSW